MANDILEYDIKKTTGDLFFQSHSTNPLLKPETIDLSIDTFLSQTKHDSLFSVTAHHMRLYDAESKAMNHDPDGLIRTQDLPVVYEENSCIYIFTKQKFLERKNRLGLNPMLLPIDAHEAVDIDEMIDFDIAEALMKQRLATL
jgi:N-acylneuraminate cytidylyltransferase